MEKEEYNIMHHFERTYWWFLGKRFLVRTMIKRLVIEEGSRGPVFLDIGCGTGMIMELLRSFGSVFGIEVSQEALQFLKQHQLKGLAQADANQSIPFKNNTFFAITCMDVLEHLEDDLAVLKEAFRVCKPGGYMIITVPAFDLLWSPHDIALHHKRRYTKKQLLNRIKGLHWEMIKCSYYNTVLFLPILFVRKLRNQLTTTTDARSDFYVNLPPWLNRMLSWVLLSEIRFLRHFDLPVGVSLLLILRKPCEFLD
jgi:ubiquinone/menaquinone biosynthesis C-methylase UbiE